MPIQKVPVIHKFGIISHSQRLELQERLLKQSYQRDVASKQQGHLSNRPQLEVTEEFVIQFNNAESISEKEKLEDHAHKILNRIKRRSGLKSGGVGNHVDLPVAWTELSQLAQCKGKVQEECLDVLISSLDQAILCKTHVPALFFLAETMLYWLRTDAVHQPYLRTAEIKLLRMGQIVFTRLFFHHMAGQLQGHAEFKNRLFTYLDGFSESQDVYNPYPNALLSMRYINEVGKMIIGDCNTEAGEVKEGDHVDYVSASASNSQEQTSGESDSHSTRSGAISSSVHDLSPTLWHSLDVWRCVKNLGGGLEEALSALGSCGLRLAGESWVDGVCAVQVLSDAAKVNMRALRTLQKLACGVHPKSVKTKEHTPNSVRVPGMGSDDLIKEASRVAREISQTDVAATAVKAEAGTDLPSGRASEASSVPTYTNAPVPENPGIHGWHWEVAITYVDCLADICLHGSTSTIQKIALVGNHKDVSLIHKMPVSHNQPMGSAGLLDLVYFTASHESHDGGPNDWSWRVRYAAIQGLVKLCKCCATEQTNEGIRTVAWNTLIKANSLERDSRVLEALKVGQVDANIEDLLSTSATETPSTIGSKIAFGLAALYLPPLPPPVDTSKPAASKHQPAKKPINFTVSRKPMRTSLRQEIMLATALQETTISYEDRTGFDLHRIVEDQWRKDLQKAEREKDHTDEKGKSSASQKKPSSNTK